MKVKKAGERVKFVLLSMTFLCAALLILGADTAVFAAPPDFQYVLAFEDHFTGTSLNENEWFYRTGFYRGSYNRAENIRVADSKLYIDFKYEDFDSDGTNEYTCGGIISRKNFGYGYYEVRAKLYGETKGLHQSFWTMGITNPPDITADYHPTYNTVLEIDGFEVDSIAPTQLHNNTHYYIPTHVGCGSKTVEVDTTDWFIMGYEWLPGKVNFYVNNEMVSTWLLDQYYAPQNLWLTALAMPNDFGGAVPPNPGAAMQVDYFRYYNKKNIGNLIGNGGFEYNSTTKNLQFPIKWVETGTKAASFVDTSDYKTGEYALKHYAASAYQVTTKQYLEKIPSSRYKLSAWVKSSGGQADAKMIVSDHGGSELSVNIPATGTWTQIVIDAIYVTNGNATISFLSNASAGQWILVDDVAFEDTTAQADDVIISDYPHASYTETGTWYPSSLKGYLNSTTRYSNVLNSYATWTPTITQPGLYDVSIFKVFHTTSDTNAKIDVVYNGGTDTQYLNYAEGESEWVYLGRYPFAQGTNGYVQNTVNTSSKNGRADAVKFVFIPQKLYIDDFESGNYTVWSTIGGTWSIITDGTKVLNQSGISTALAITGNPTWDNYAVSAQVKRIYTSGMPGIVARYNDTANFYTFRVNRATNNVELWKVVNNVWASLGTAEFIESNYSWYKLKMVLNDDSIQCYVNQTLKITATDSSLLSGKAGLRTVSTSASYDDFVIEAIN